jgi:hypothetical protein
MTAQLRVEDFDPVLLAARAAGLDAGKLEIRPPSGAGRAWTVNEIDRSWPTRLMLSRSMVQRCKSWTALIFPTFRSWLS